MYQVSVARFGESLTVTSFKFGRAAYDFAYAAEAAGMQWFVTWNGRYQASGAGAAYCEAARSQ